MVHARLSRSKYNATYSLRFVTKHENRGRTDQPKDMDLQRLALDVCNQHFGSVCHVSLLHVQLPEPANCGSVL